MRDYVIYGMNTQNSRKEIIGIVNCKNVNRTKEMKKAKNLLEIDVYEVVGSMSVTFWNSFSDTSTIYTREL